MSGAYAISVHLFTWSLSILQVEYIANVYLMYDYNRTITTEIRLLVYYKISIHSKHLSMTLHFQRKGKMIRKIR